MLKIHRTTYDHIRPENNKRPIFGSILTKKSKLLDHYNLETKDLILEIQELMESTLLQPIDGGFKDLIEKTKILFSNTPFLEKIGQTFSIEIKCALESKKLNKEEIRDLCLPILSEQYEEHLKNLCYFGNYSEDDDNDFILNFFLNENPSVMYLVRNRKVNLDQACNAFMYFLKFFGNVVD